MGWDEYIYLSVYSHPPYLSLLYQSTSSALVINKEDLYQKKRSTAFQLPDTPASLTLTLTSAISSHQPITCTTCHMVGGVTLSVSFWTNRGHRYGPFSPPVRAFLFYTPHKYMHLNTQQWQQQ